MRAIRILFAIFSFSIFSYDLQLRSSDFQRLILAVLTIIAIAAGSFSTVW